MVKDPEKLLPSDASATFSRMLAGPTGLLFWSQLIAKWLRLYREWPTRFQTPRQKLLVTGGREEFMISVWSLCHCAEALSIGVASGMSALPRAVKVTCQKPTIGSSELCSEASTTDAAGYSPAYWHA